MAEEDKKLVATEYASAEDAEALEHLKQSIANGQHWYLALLGAIGITVGWWKKRTAS